MRKENFAEVLGDINEKHIVGARAGRKAKEPVWVKGGRVVACLRLVVGLFANSFIKLFTTQVLLPDGILAKVTELVDNENCKVVVTGEDRKFNNGDTLKIRYSIQENSDKADKQLEVDNIIAVTYENYEEKDSAYSITVEY